MSLTNVFSDYLLLLPKTTIRPSNGVLKKSPQVSMVHEKGRQRTIAGASVLICMYDRTNK